MSYIKGYGTVITRLEMNIARHFSITDYDYVHNGEPT